MTLSASDRVELDDATAFERYAIASTIPAHADASNTSAIDFRGQTGQIEVGAEIPVHVAIGLTENLSAGAVSATVAKVRPLLFGAAYKVIDVMLEFALERAGLVPQNNRRWLMAEKVAHARTSVGDLPPLTTDADIWERICALYAGWQEVRHSLVHRTAKVDPSTGALVGHDQVGAPIAPITVDEQDGFARIAVEASSAVIGGGLPERLRRRLRWRLNQLQPHHSLSPVPDASKPGTAVTVIANLEQADDGKWRVATGALLAKARSVFAEASEFNGEFHAVVDEQDRTFRCRLEDAPGLSEFSLDALPEWLVEP